MLWFLIENAMVSYRKCYGFYAMLWFLIENAMVFFIENAMASMLCYGFL